MNLHVCWKHVGEVVMPRGLVQLDLKSRGSTLGGDVSSFVLLRHVFHSTAFDEVHLTSNYALASIFFFDNESRRQRYRTTG